MNHNFTLITALLLAPLAVLHAADQPHHRPNVVYILADDVGWGDLSVHGGGVPTPNIDRLFKRGVELRNFMGWCVCSPTRAMLLTGRHPIRVGTAPEVGGELELEETTIAEAFKANGYRTGVFGKWHNGDDPDTPEFQTAFKEAFKSLPNKTHKGGHGANAHGFDEAWVYYGGGADYFNRRTVQGRGPVSWWHNREFRGNDEGYTDVAAIDKWKGGGHVARPHLENWLDAIRDGAPLNAPVEVGHRTVTICHLANIARELNRALRWNPEAEHFVDDSDANTLLDRPRRSGFELPQG